MRVRLDEMGPWDEELPSAAIDRAVPVGIDSDGDPISVGDAIEIQDGLLAGEVEPGSYHLVWRHESP